MSDSVNGSDFQERRQNLDRFLPAPSENIERDRSSRVAVRPAHAHFATPFTVAEESGGVSLRQLRDIVGKHRGKIAAFMVLATVLTAILTRKITPIYQATATINVERRGNGGVIGQAAAQSGTSSDLDQVMTTQVQLIQTDPVLRPATEKYNLLDVEHQFNGLKPNEAARLRSAPIKLRRLKVSRVPNTFLIEISYRAEDPKFAAEVANTIAESYVMHAFDSRNRSYVQVSEAVQHRLKDLQVKMELAGEALAKFARELNVVDPDQRINILTTRLMQLNADYSNAQSERLKKEAIYREAQSGSLASAEVSAHGEDLQHLVERLNTARQQFAIVRTTFGENNPEYKKSQNEVSELEQQVRELQANALERVQIDYRQAAGREEMAQKAVAETRAQVDALNNRLFEYQQLKDDAENSKKLHNDLQRATSEQEINQTFQDAIVQIEEPARPATKHIFPSLTINLTLAMLLSGLLGIGFAVLHEMLDTKLRGPEQAAKLLNVEVIAILPKTRRLSVLAGGKADTKVVGKMPKTRRTHMLIQYQESIRALRNAIDMAEVEGAFRSVMLTSARAGEGKSTISANLAFSYGRIGRKVLLIDADLRRPRLHNFYEKPMDMGLAEVLENKCKWTDVLLKVAREDVYLLRAGTMSESSPDLIVQGIRHLLDEAYAGRSTTGRGRMPATGRTL